MKLLTPQLVVALSFSLLARTPVPAQLTAAKVTGGEIAGERQGGVSSFKGIPFAAPPVGPLRWRAPQPVKAWEGVRQATAFAPSPMQNPWLAGLMRVPQNFSEDCLYLNVWTPATNTTEKLPVMVWIYGGAYAFGSTAIPVYDGTHLAQKGVIVVSVAYRLGAFGFLAHPELSRQGEKGNFGLRDQVAGLEWVRDNIAAFGGDPDQVTIFGESAGSISVSLLVSSPKAKGLFRRAIAESGAAFFPPQRSNDELGLVSTLKHAEQQGKEFLTALGVTNITAARELPPSKIQDAKFSPAACYDGDLLATTPPALYQEKRFNDTPILLGINSDDGGMFVRGNQTPDEWISEVRNASGDYADKLLAFYPHNDQAATSRAAKDLARDAFFSWPTWYWARLQAEFGTGKAFAYYYDHRTPGSPNGASHAAELGYVFKNLESPRPEDTRMSELVSSYWVNFAKTGNPNGAALPEWQPFTVTSQKVLVLDASPRMEPWPNLAPLKVLDDFFAYRRKEAQSQ